MLIKKIVLSIFSVLIFGLVQAQVIPDVFDLRNFNNTNFVSSVKSQDGGTCWTHGAMAAMEGNLLMTGNWEAVGDTGEPNLAEYHLDWWNGFNEFNNDDIFPLTGGLTVHFGGDYLVSAAYLTRGEGAVREIDGQSYINPPELYEPLYHIYYPRNIEWFTLDSNMLNLNQIKLKIMEEGVMGTCMCYDVNFINSNFIHYQPPSSSSEPNHAIAIIGWNDTLSTQAPNPGAWLCKNSWGDSWGNDGYFWISYYDKHTARHPEMGAISFQDVELNTFKNIYYYDYHGWRDTKIDVTEAFNVFKASSTEAVKSISFYTAQDDVDYIVIIFGNFQTELSDTLSIESGHIAFKGFHTIDLNSYAYLNSAQDFYVYVKISAGGHAYDRTSEVPVLLGSSQRTIVESKANPNESYFRFNNIWKDLFEIDETANFCIKALTIEPVPTQAATPSGETFICQSPENFFYETTGSLNAIDYSWELLPSNSGTIYGNNLGAIVEWDSLFVGTAEIYVKGINLYGEGMFSEPLFVEILAVPQVNLGNDTVLCMSDKFAIDAGNEGCSYIWTNSYGQEIYYDQILEIDSSTFGLGTETFSVVVVDSNACENSDEITITYEQCMNVINYELNYDFQILPNINNGIFQINLSEIKGFSDVLIYNIYGETVYQEKFYNSKSDFRKTIDISNKVNGVYIIKIVNEQNIISRKFIISKQF